MASASTASTRPATSQNAKGNILAQWTFSEYEQHHRGIWWYICAIGITIGLFIYALTTNNFLFALIILLVAIILFTHHRSQPLELSCTIYTTGLEIGNHFYLWRELESFWIIYEPPIVKRLYFTLKGAMLRREVSVPLQKENPLQIRSILLDYVAEDLSKDQESSRDIMIRLLKL